VIGFAQIAAGAPSSVSAMTQHLWNQTLPEREQRLAAYYSKGVVRDPEVAEAIYAARVVKHAHAWDAGQAAPDLNLLADYVVRPAAAFSRGDIEARLLQQVEQAIAQREDGSLPPEARAVHDLPEQPPLAANLARMTADELRSYRDHLPDLWMAAIVAADSRTKALAAGPANAPHTHLAIVRPNIHPLAAQGLGIGPDRRLAPEQINALLSGHRADGAAIEGKRSVKERRLPVNPKDGVRRWSTPIGSYDFCPTPDKSVSVAWAFAPANEQAQIYNAHIEASREAMDYIAERVGHARLGDGGKKGSEPGHVGWLEFTHHTARRTQISVQDGAVVVVQDRGTAGDPDLHTHFLIPNAVFCDSGRVGSMDTAAIGGFVFEADAFYHARLGQKLRDAGFAVDLNSRTGAAVLPVIPTEVNDLFSKRTKAGELLARKYTAEIGEDWDALSPDQREARMKTATQDREQKAKGGKDDVANFADWHRQAKEIGWEPPRSLQLVGPVQALTAEQRHRQAYETSLSHLAGQLEHRSVLQHFVARVAAFRGLVEWGCEGRSDADAVTALMRQEGVLQYGERTALKWGQEAGRRYLSVTTTLHETQEAEFVALAKAAAADRTGAIPAPLLARHLAASGLDFADTHGQAQRTAIERLGTGGRFGVVIAAAGAGKTTALKPLVTAWKEQGRTVYGTSLASRQSDDLVNAGISQRNLRAVGPLIDAIRADPHEPSPYPPMRLDRNSVLAVDELGLLGTRQGLELMRLQAQHGFTIVALGDPKQCASIEAGDIIDLSRRALGAEQVPEILTTRRQKTDREKAIVGLLRVGRAAEALTMKRADGTAELVVGGHQGVVARTAKLYVERLEATGQAPSISAPTNLEAHRISEAVRLERRRLGQLGPDLRQVRAIDADGRQYGMALAVGDRVRLFKSTRAADRGGSIGRNGSVLEVTGIDDQGVTLRKADGRVGTVAWKTLTDQPSRRLLLAYGDATTIHAAQGLTSPEHILALPSGSRTIDGAKGYSGLTRHEQVSFILTNDAAEHEAVRASRPLNDAHGITLDDKWSAVARALAYQPERDTATALRERLGRLQQGAVRDFQATVPSPAQAHGTEAEHVQDWTMRRLAERAVESIRELVHQVQQRTPALLEQQRTQQDQARNFWERVREGGQEAKRESQAERESQQEDRGHTMRP
jgi:hypothetical protein